jgi:hypothetical protein
MTSNLKKKQKKNKKSNLNSTSVYLLNTCQTENKQAHAPSLTVA